MAVLADRLTVFEEVFEKVAEAATKETPSGYASEDDTRPSKSPDSELRNLKSLPQSSVDCRKQKRRHPKHPTIWQIGFAHSSTRTSAL